LHSSKTIWGTEGLQLLPRNFRLPYSPPSRMCSHNGVPRNAVLSRGS
jgi:hypothetical protein